MLLSPLGLALRYVSDMPDAQDSDNKPGIYLIAAHPAWRRSRVNQRLLAGARTIAREAATLDIQDLYATYPDYAIDVAAEQARVEVAQLVVLMHPIQWYSMPALQKLWLDEVLTYGWAYGASSAEPGSRDQAPAGAPGTALRGKDLWLVATTGAPEDSYRPGSYNRHLFEDFMPPYRQTAELCGMRFLPPLVLHGAHDASNQEVDAHVRHFCDLLQRYPHGAGTL